LRVTDGRLAGKHPRISQGDVVLLGGDVGALVGGEHGAVLVLDVVEHLARQLDVVVGELADLGVVDAEDLGLLASAEPQAGDEVHDEEDDRGADEAVEAAREGVGQLVADLDPVVVDPAAGDDLDVVQVGNIVGSEEGGAHVAHQASDAVHGEDVQSVVDAQDELELGGVISEGRPQDAIRHRCPDWYVAFTPFFVSVVNI